MSRPVSRTQGTVGAGAVNVDACRILAGAGAPTDGTSGTGAGDAGPGSLYSDVTNAFLYINTNTKASPTWTKVGTQS